jgi:phosphoglycolate phosphatase
MTPKVVIFDWDGTLVDSIEHIAGSLYRAATELGYPARDFEAYRDIIGLGIVEALEKLYPGLSVEEMSAIRSGYREYFFKETTTPRNVFTGAEAVLADLKKAGAVLAVATGKSRHGLDLALQTTELGRYFDITCCADETRSKPDPAMLEVVTARLGITPQEAVMIGDTVYDMEMAQRIGMSAIGVEWGVHSREQLESFRPSKITTTMDELRRALDV